MQLRVHLRGEELKDGMVTDFKHLNWFKKFVDDVIDHKFIIDSQDPLFNTLLPDFKNDFENEATKDNLGNLTQHFTYNQRGYYTLPPEKYKHLPVHLQEMYEGYVIVDFVPTSENLSKWFYDIVKEKMKELCDVSRIEFWETPKSRSQYTG
jgi:6-pyruvoyltetrahydropterin/6-carboxytetrahydropterin synthase